MSPRFWLPLLVGSILLGMMMNLPWLVFLATGTGTMLLIAHLWRRRSLQKLTYRRHWVYTRGFPGESLPVRLDVENHKHLPVFWLRITDEWPAAAPPTDRQLLSPSHRADRSLFTHLYSLRGQQRIQRSYQLALGRRGIYPVGPATLESGDPFGIYEETRQETQQDTLTVFPEILPLSSLNLPTEDPFGDRASHRQLFDDPNLTIGVRPYHTEDSLRRIHWGATARTGELQVRVYQPVSARVMMVCLNVSVSEHYWEVVDQDSLEQMAKIAATLAYNGVQEGYSVGLLSNGGLSNADHPFRIAPGQSPQHLAALLQALAGVTPLTMSVFEDLLVRSLPEVPLGATLLIVTSQVQPILVDTLVRLRKYRSHTTLISISPDVPPVIPGVRVVHLPFQG